MTSLVVNIESVNVFQGNMVRVPYLEVPAPTPAPQRIVVPRLDESDWPMTQNRVPPPQFVQPPRPNPPVPFLEVPTPTPAPQRVMVPRLEVPQPAPVQAAPQLIPVPRLPVPFLEVAEPETEATPSTGRIQRVPVAFPIPQINWPPEPQPQLAPNQTCNLAADRLRQMGTLETLLMEGLKTFGSKVNLRPEKLNLAKVDNLFKYVKGSDKETNKVRGVYAGCYFANNGLCWVNTHRMARVLGISKSAVQDYVYNRYNLIREEDVEPWRIKFEQQTADFGLNGHHWKLCQTKCVRFFIKY